MSSDRVHCIFGFDASGPLSAAIQPITLMPAAIRRPYRSGVDKLAVAAQPDITGAIVSNFTDVELAAAEPSGVLCVPALSGAKPEDASEPCRVVVRYAWPGTAKVHYLAFEPGRSPGVNILVKLRCRMMAAGIAKNVGDKKSTGVGGAPASRRRGPGV